MLDMIYRTQLDTKVMHKERKLKSSLYWNF